MKLESTEKHWADIEKALKNKFAFIKDIFNDEPRRPSSEGDDDDADAPPAGPYTDADLEAF